MYSRHASPRGVGQTRAAVAAERPVGTESGFTATSPGMREPVPPPKQAARVPQSKSSRAASHQGGKGVRSLPRSQAASAARPLSKTSNTIAERSTTEALSLEEVMHLNHVAMEALRENRTQESHVVLTQALGVAEREVHRLQQELEMARAAPAESGECRKGNGGKRTKRSRAKQEVPRSQATLSTLKETHEAWLLGYAETLSNLGCQLRRDGKEEEALVCLRDARDVESSIAGGKPSCSTMMNLSAVLLGMGKVEEALPIAKDCVAAAQQGDHVLFITALHNLAVTLGQQPGERERNAALPTMLRALREAQEYLGDSDPTTLMLKEKCATTHRWVLSQKQQSSPSPPSLRSPAFPATARANHTAAHAQTRHRPSSLPGAAKKPPVNLAPLSATDIVGPRAGHPRLTPSSNTFPGPAHLPLASVQDRLIYDSSRQRENVAPGKQLDPVQSNAWTAHVGHEPGCENVADEEDDSFGGLAETSAYCQEAVSAVVDGAPCVECVKCPSVDLAGDETRSHYDTSSSPAAVAEAELVERSAHSSRVESEASGSSRLAAVAPPQTEAAIVSLPRKSLLATGHRVNIHGQEKPSFLRFAAIEDMQSAESPSRESVYLTYHQIRQKLRRQRDATVAKPTQDTHIAERGGSDDKDVLRNVPVGKHQREEATGPQTESDATRVVTHSVFQKTVPMDNTTAGSLAPTLMTQSTSARSRQMRLAAEQREEEAYRKRKAVEDAAAEEEARFQAALDVITTRTRNRAAVKIQSVWQPWWALVGKPRREAQLRRAEERERRLRERLLKMAELTHSEQQQQHRDKIHAVSKEKVGGLAAPGVVVRCGLAWLEKTVGVRYLVRHRLQRGAQTSPLEKSNTRITETQVQVYVTRIQAAWRGHVQRRRYVGTVRRQPAAHMVALRRTHFTDDMAAFREREAQEYAAMVIQNTYRCWLARKCRAARYVEVFTPRAVQIQQWYRATLDDQRRRGVDACTVRRCNSAALVIQCAWRCFQARLRLYMERIKRHMRHLRLQESEEKRLAYEQEQILLLEARQTTEARAAALREKEQTAMAEAEAIAAQLRAEEEARGPGFVSAYSGKFYPDIVLRRSSYGDACADRIYDVYRKQEADHESQEVPLHAEPVAERVREDWARQIHLRPFVVARRRAAEELRCEEEAFAVRRHRAAMKIQREFRSWLRHRHNPNRDSSLLLISLSKYQQAGLERQIQRKQHRRRQERGIAIFGDAARDMRETLKSAREELAEQEEMARQSRLAHLEPLSDPKTAVIPPSPSPFLAVAQQVVASVGEDSHVTEPPFLVGQSGSALASGPLQGGGSNSEENSHGPRSRRRRWEDEKTLRVDEQRVAESYPRELAALRGDVYYKGYAGQEQEH